MEELLQHKSEVNKVVKMMFSCMCSKMVLRTSEVVQMSQAPEKAIASGRNGMRET